MLKEVHPMLPMRNYDATKNFYVDQLGFSVLGDENFKPYLMLRKDHVEIHFFEFKELNPKENYGQIYIRTDQIKELYQQLKSNGVEIHPNGDLQIKPWKQMEFSILDPDYNLIIFGQNFA